MNPHFDEQDILRILQGQTTGEELSALRQWLEAGEEHRKQFDQAKALWNALQAAEPADGRMQDEQRKRLRERLRSMGAKADSRRPAPRLRWIRVAATVLMLAVVGSAIWYMHWRMQPKAGTQTEWAQRPGQVELTLSDGQCVELTNDDLLIDTEHERGVASNDGMIDYTQVKPMEGVEPEILYNKIETKTGGCYELKLADGTRVWLNAQSELRFPIRFGTGERRVYLVGEAYFEVEHDEAHPFVVSTQSGALDVCVYGTHFDIEAYSPEHVRATLMEGSVGINDIARQAIHMLEPNNTALLNVLNGQIEISACDAAEYVLWKDGILSFDEMSVEQLMQRINRYYGVEAVYADDSVRMVTLTGMLRYDENLTNLLQTLESVSNLKFEQTGGWVMVRHR